MWQVVGRGEVHIGLLVKKLEVRGTLGRLRRGWEDNIKNGYCGRRRLD
jgi:hypothetical protein